MEEEFVPKGFTLIETPQDSEEFVPKGFSLVEENRKPVTQNQSVPFTNQVLATDSLINDLKQNPGYPEKSKDAIIKEAKEIKPSNPLKTISDSFGLSNNETFIKNVQVEVEKKKAEQAIKDSAKLEQSLYTVAKAQTGVTDELLNYEYENGADPMFNATKTITSEVEKTKQFLANPDLNREDLETDLSIKLKGINEEKEKLKLQLKEDISNSKMLLGQNAEEGADAFKSQVETNKKIQELDEAYINLKRIYVDEPQRLKINPLVKIYDENPEFLYTLSETDFDKMTSNYGAFLQFPGEEELRVAYLKNRDLTNKGDDRNYFQKVADTKIQGDVALGLTQSLIENAINSPIDKREIQKVDRIGYMATLDDLSNKALIQAESVSKKVEELNKKYEGKLTTEKVYNEYKKEFDLLQPEIDNAKKLEGFIKQKALEAKDKFKDLEYTESVQKLINHYDQLSGHSSGVGWAIKENVGNFVPRLTTGLKQLYRLTQSEEDQNTYGFQDIVNYKWNTTQIPDYYKQTPAVERDKDALFGIKVNSSAFYNIAKVSLESTELLVAAYLTGGTGLAAEAGVGSLSAIGAGLGSASTIVLPTMIMTSADATSSYLEQGMPPSLANKLGLVTGLIEGLTEVLNPIELTGLSKLTTLTNRLSNKGAYRALLNDVFKKTTGKVPSKQLAKILLGDFKTFGKEFAWQGIMESVEEEVGLGLNAIKNYVAKQQKPDLKIGEDEELTWENAAMTAANTMISMPVLGAFGAGVQLYQERNSVLPTARFIAGQNLDAYLQQLDTDFANKKMPKEVYDATKQELTKLGENYKANKFTVDNLVEEDEQIKFFNLVNLQQEQAKKILPEANNDEALEQLDNTTQELTRYKQKALLNSAKTPQEKFKVVENIVLENIDKQYTPEFIKSVNDSNRDAVKKDLIQRLEFIKSPKVAQKVNEILQQVEQKQQVEEEIKETEKEDDVYLKQKKQETLLTSVLSKLQNPENQELTEEESIFLEENEGLVTQKLQELETPEEQTPEGFTGQEKLDEVFNIKRIEEPVENIDEKISNLIESYKKIKSQLKEFPNEQKTLDPLTGNYFTGTELMEQIRDVENKQDITSWMGEEFSKRRGYTEEQIKIFFGKNGRNDIVNQLIDLVGQKEAQNLLTDIDFELQQPKVEEKIQQKSVTQTEQTKLEIETNPNTNLTLEQEKQQLEQTENDINKSNKSSNEFILKLANLEKPLEETPSLFNFANKLLISVFDKIAYLSRSFNRETFKEDSDTLNAEFAFLNSPEIEEGYEIQFKLSDSNSFTVSNRNQFEENKVLLLERGVVNEINGDLLNYQKLYSDDNNFREISITDSKGRNFGSVHTIDYIREDRVLPVVGELQEYGDNLKENLTNLIAFRQELISQLKKGITPKAKITKKTIGSLSIKSDRTYIPLTEAIKNKEVLDTLQVVLKPNEVVKSNKETINKKILANSLGNVVVLLPTPTGDNFAFSVKRTELGTELAQSVGNSIRLFSEYQKALLSSDIQRQQELNNIADSITETLGAEYDIREFIGLRNYISLFVFNGAKTSSFTSADNRIERQEIPFIDFDEKNQAITYSNKRFFGTVESTEDISSFEKLKQVGIFKQFLNSEKADLDKFLPDFEKFLADRNLAVKSNLFEKEEPFEIPLLDENFEFVDNERTKAPTYKEFIINNSETNILEHEIKSPSGKKEFSYFQQPTFSFEIEKLVKQKKKTKTQLYKESEEFKNKTTGFTSLPIENREYFYQLNGSKITILNTKGNKLKPSAKKYPEVLEKVLLLNYENLRPDIRLINRELTSLVTVDEDQLTNREGSLEWYISQIGKIYFERDINGTGRNSPYFQEILDQLDIQLDAGITVEKQLKANKVFKNWLTVDKKKGATIDEWARQIEESLPSSKGENVIEEILEFIFRFPGGMTEYEKYSKKDEAIGGILVDLGKIFDIYIRPVSLNKISTPFFNVEYEMEGEKPEKIEDIDLTEEELEQIKQEADANFTDEEEFKYLDELQLSQEFQEAQQEYIEYENKVQQTEDNQLDDSSEEEEETTGEIKESEEDLDDFSFYNEEKPLENLQLDIKNQYNSLSLLYNSLTKEEKMNIGSLQGFIDSYKNSEIEPTEEFLIEELKCRKNK
jgi:hypothetical protein